MGFFKHTDKPVHRRRRRRQVFGKLNRSGVSTDWQPKHIFLGVISLILFSFLLLGLFSLFASDYFKVDSIEIFGTHRVSEQELLSKFEEIKGKNIFLITSSNIRPLLAEDFPNIKLTRVQKFWPNKLSLTVSEQEPLLFYTNLNGVYLVDTDGVINEVIIQEKINFAEPQLNIITGVEGMNSKLVEERLASEYEQEQPIEEPTDPETEPEQEFDFSTISNEQKLATLEIIKSELVDQAKAIMFSYEEKYNPEAYPDLEKVFAFNNKTHAVGDTIDKNRLDLTREVVKFFNRNRDETIKEIYWEGDFIVKVVSESGKTLIFGITRTVSDQLEDFLIITTEIKANEKDFSEIDLSSEKVSVK